MWVLHVISRSNSLMPDRLRSHPEAAAYQDLKAEAGYPILVAPLADVGAMDGGLQGKVRNDEVTRYRPLPILGAADEFTVDLSLVQPVLRQDLLAGQRFFSMPPEGRLALADRLFSMISIRERPDDQ